MPRYLEIKVTKLVCRRVSDDVFEGPDQDEISIVVSGGGTRLSPEYVIGGTGEKKVSQLNREVEVDWPVCTVDWEPSPPHVPIPYVNVKCWDTDTTSSDDLLGWFSVKRNSDGSLFIRPVHDTAWDGEKFHFHGAGSLYWFWFQFTSHD